MTRENRIAPSARGQLCHTGARAIGRRRLLSAIGLTIGAGLTAQALGAPTAMAAAESDPSPACRKAGSRLAPLAYARANVIPARETYRILLEALTAIGDRNALVLQLSLKEATERLDEIGAPPDALMVLAQIRVVQRDLAQRSNNPDIRLWETLGGDIEQYLSDAANIDRNWVTTKFREAKAAMMHGKSEAATTGLQRLLSAFGRRFDALAIDLAYEDVSSALQAAKEPVPLWKGAKTAVRSALAQLNWAVRGEPLPLLQAYYATNEALDACPNEPDAARHLLLEAADALGRESPRLAGQAKALSSEPVPDRAKLAVLAKAISGAIERTQKRAAADYSSSRQSD